MCFRFFLLFLGSCETGLKLLKPIYSFGGRARYVLKQNIILWEIWSWLPNSTVEYMDVSKNGGFPQQPWVSLLKMIMLGCFGGTPIFGNIRILIWDWHYKICHTPKKSFKQVWSQKRYPDTLKMSLVKISNPSRQIEHQQKQWLRQGSKHLLLIGEEVSCYKNIQKPKKCSIDWRSGESPRKHHP